MPSTVFDSAIFRDMFGTPARRRLVDPAHYLGTAGQMVDRVLERK